MRAMSLGRLSLCPFLLLQSALLLGGALVAVGPARADDCSSFTEVCVREAMTTNGNSRILTVTLNKGADFVDWFNVIVPGHAQAELKLGGTLKLDIQPDGTATYSAQACWNAGLGSRCNAWRQVTRRFAPVSTCQGYMDAAMTAINQSDNLGCGFSGAGRWDHNAQAHLSACLNFVGDFQSFVNNETNLRANDLAACKARIAAANTPAKPIKTTGKAKAGGGAGGAPTPAAVMKCQGGGGMTITTGSGSGVFVNFAPAAQGANASAPGPGQCAWADRVLAQGEAHRLAFLTTAANAQLLLQATKGGTFQVTATPIGTVFIMVKTIDNVQVVDSSPLSPGPVAAGDDTGDDAGGGDNAPPMAADGSCGGPGAVATVVIPEPNLHKLNLRSKPGGQVLGTVPEGAQVTVVGPCGSEAAAGFAKTAKPLGAMAGWCQLDAPASGCVMAKYLDFSGGGGDDAAGFAPAAGFAKSKTPGPVEFGKGGGAADTGDDAGNDTGGGNANPPVTDDSCGGPGRVATVVIPEPNLHKLNVRSKPGGNVLGTVPEGAEVTVVGPCGSEAAAGFAKSTKPLGGTAGWCQIDTPVSGCVLAKYLGSPGGGDDDAADAPAAGFAKTPPKAEAPMGVSFSGRWAANADDVSYTLSLKQKGSGVSGSFQGSDGSAGTLNGKLQGNVLRFSFVQKDGTRGTGQFALADDGQSFDGSYRLSDNTAQGSWNGTRQ